ncbi:MAG TPA: S4 domain-containing protein [Longimicrobiaceae bacterium]|nr:S4 domain-containing protein [Longimicrobiaceae bacterium]
MRAEAVLRVDVLLHRLCLTRSRSEAKAACDSGAVLVAGRAAKASQEVAAGAQVTIRYPRRTLEIAIDRLPPKSTSKKSAREMYRVLSEEPAPGL